MIDLNKVRTIKSGKKKINQLENDLQRQIEDGMDEFYPFHVQNHGIHLGVVFSKWKLCDALETDMMYIAKSTETWWVVLVEFELPNIDIFTKGGDFSAAFNKGISQIDKWRSHIERNRDQVISRVKPYLMPEHPGMHNNPIEFKYLLISGRKTSLADPQLKGMLNSRMDNDFMIKTWDSMLDNAKMGAPLYGGLNVVSETKGKLKFKNLNRVPNLHDFKPHQIEFNDEDVVKLRNEGVDIDSWLTGNSNPNASVGLSSTSFDKAFPRIGRE